MKTIALAESAIAEQMGRSELTEYMLDVAENGHKPGMLSGANLKGKARQYSGRYAQTRNKLLNAVRAATNGRITDGTVLINSRWSRVWVDVKTGQQVGINVITNS